MSDTPQRNPVTEPRATTKKRDSAARPRLSAPIFDATLTLAALLLPFVNGMWAGPPPADADLDSRFMMVAGGSSLLLLAVVAKQATEREGLRRTARISVAAVLGIVALIAIFRSRDALFASAVSTVVVIGSAALFVGACVRMARAVDAPAWARALCIGGTFVMGMPPWLAVTWGLVAMQLSVAPVRLAHGDRELLAGQEAVDLRASDGTLLRGTYSPGRRGAAGIVVLHGVADGRSRMDPWAAFLSESGFHVLAIDFRAHGTSEGAVVSFCDRERLDADAALQWLRERSGVHPRRFYFVGTSMGGGVALAAAAEHVEEGVRGVIAMAPASDYESLIESRLSLAGPLAPGMRALVSVVARGLGQRPPGELSPRAALAVDPTLPVLVFHGDADTTIPLSLSQELAAAHPATRIEVLPGVGHDEIPGVVMQNELARELVVQFLRAPRRTVRESERDEED